MLPYGILCYKLPLSLTRMSLEDDRKLIYYDPRGVNVSVVHPTSGARELINEKWLSDGVLEAWLPASRVTNILPGHKGAWRVRFPPQHGHRDVVVYMSHNEAVASRKRSMPSMELRSEAIIAATSAGASYKAQWQYLNRRITYFDRFICTCVVLLYLMYPTLTRATFKLVACQTVGCRRYLTLDLDLECWNEDHLPWVFLLFVPALFVYVLGLPAAAL